MFYHVYDAWVIFLERMHISHLARISSVFLYEPISVLCARLDPVFHAQFPADASSHYVVLYIAQLLVNSFTYQ